MASSVRNSTENPPDLDQPPTTSTLHSLSKAVHARKADYTRPQKIKVKIGSWNVAACTGTEKDLGAWFVEGKGIDEHLAGSDIAKGIETDGSQDNVESVGAQEARHRKKDSTVPKGDQGTIVGGDDVGIYVLGLQEVVDLSSATQYIGRVYTDSEPANKWRKALMAALPRGYQLIAEQQLSGLLLFVCASPTIAPTISSVSTVSVGTGVMGYLGNKGAVTTRIVLGETTRLVFVNSHLASGTDPAHLDRRCWDVAQILQRTQFTPISWAGVLEDTLESIGDEDFAFWFGDLNFRLDGLPGNDIRRLLMLHTKGEYDIGQPSREKINDEMRNNDGPIVIRSVDSDSESDEGSAPNTGTSSTFDSTFDGADDASSTSLPDPDDFVQDPHQDPLSLQATLDSLLPHDQLFHMQKQKKAFHDGWKEGQITFLPTYKYDVGSMGMFDSSGKKRAPSWCDRILYRTRKDKLEFDGKSHEEELARIKDAEMKSRGLDHASEDEDVLFDYDPDEDGADDAQEDTPPTDTKITKDTYIEYDERADDSAEEVVTKEGFVDRIQLNVYTSHQRVLSSDHKPLNAVFTLEYDAVVPELKSRVQQEVARELDRAENEGRPGITIVVESSMDEAPKVDGPSSRRPSTGGAEGVDFGNVSFQRRKTRSLTIANTSQVPSTFAFVGRPSASGEEDRIAPPWLSVCFVGSETDEQERKSERLKAEVTLQPGDAVNATLELFIDDVSFVTVLNEAAAQLDDVLVLRVTDGRDHFIPIRGTWLQSCFGRSIEDLIRIPEGGVRALVPPRRANGPPVNRGRAVCWSAPRELFKLTEAIELLTDRVIADSNMLDDVHLPTDSPGWPFDSHSWLQEDAKTREQYKSFALEALDSDQSLAESFPLEVSSMDKLEIISEVLITFLTSLTDGVVTTTLWAKLDLDFTSLGNKTLTDTEYVKAWVLDVLSAAPNHNISFVFLMSMLCRVAGELAPLPKNPFGNGLAQEVRNARGSIDTMRRSLSWKGRAAPARVDPNIAKRSTVENHYADVFKNVIFRVDPAGNLKDKERRQSEDRRHEILEAFLKGGR